MLVSDSAAKNSSPTSVSTTTTGSSTTDTRISDSVVQSKVNIIAIGVSIAMLLILSTILILIITATVLIWSYKKTSSKQVNNHSPYSTLNRRAGQPQSLHKDSPELYDQNLIYSSPSTDLADSAEYIPNSETANNNVSQTLL